MLVQLALRGGLDKGDCRTPEQTVEPAGVVVG